VSGFPEANRREERKHGLLRKHRLGSQPTQWARRGVSHGLSARGGDVSPCNMSAAERERRSPLERKERVCGECPAQVLIFMEKLVLCFVFRKTL